MPFLDKRTVTVLDIKSEDVRSILKFSDRSRKKFIETIIFINFPEYYSSDTICDELSKLIEQYRKEYTRRLINNPIYLSWEKRDPIDDKTATLLNVKLGSGASAFVEHLITHTLIPRELNSHDIRQPILGNKEVPDRSDAKETTGSPNIQNNTSDSSFNQMSDDNLAFMELTERQFDD